MKTKTYPALISSIFKTLGNGIVINHIATPQNPLGQSSVHSFIDDLMDVIEKHCDYKDPLNPNHTADLFKALFILLEKQNK